MAADPACSVWVSAHAGSGKTHVLSRRVIRLLLRGIEPSRILCLTYTRSAAANMSKRVYDELARWTTMTEAELAREISALEGAEPDAESLARARRLFAMSLETPGGLKIQTIHAFCEAILHQFTLEANIAGHFELLDQEMENALVAEARRQMIASAGLSGEERLAAAFGAVLGAAGEWGLEALLKEIVKGRDAIGAFIRQVREPDGTCPKLFGEFGFGSEETADSIAAAAWPLPGFDASQFWHFAQVARQVEARTVLDKMLPHAEAAYAETHPQRRLHLLCQGFLKKDGQPYARLGAKILTEKIPDLMERYQAAAEAIRKAADRLALFRMLELTSSAMTLAEWLIARYEQLKAARGFLDFNDLITRTVKLLSRPDVGAWVRYKLDQGIDHILVDEAQDTSPEQWRVIEGLVEEFFAGEGARRGAQRTLFAVGDEKQSIYSFQGADPALFNHNGHVFCQRARAARQDFRFVKLDTSFRSTEEVLRAVDLVFSRPEAMKGLTRDAETIEHVAIRVDQPGYVELWPSIAATQNEEPDDWLKTVDHEMAPAVRLADEIARTVKAWLDRDEVLEGRGRRLKPGDILVLVRKRDRFIHALSRALKKCGVAVSGADRLNLAGHIAVKDLAAIGRVALQPHDDLSLAALLRSPIFALTDDDLFAIAHGRGRQSLMQALRRKAESDLILTSVVRQLDRWANEAAFKPVFDFYATLLARDGVRSRLMARLGPEAGDLIDEFLSFCLAEEKTGLPGLEAFLATLDSSAPEIKREMDQSRAELRIMTVHAAKGLEAPVVFLVDNGGRPFEAQHLPRLVPIESRLRLWRDEGFLWRAGAGYKNSESARAEARIREAAEDEYRRLLYVGMTRAEDRLIVCGYHGNGAQNPQTWHVLVSEALASWGEVENLPDPVGGPESFRRRYRRTARPEGVAVEPTGNVGERPTPPPLWLRQPLEPEETLPRPLSPSGAGVAVDEGSFRARTVRSPVLSREPSFAIDRGLAIHRLLQVLPDLPEGDRGAAAARFLASAGRGWPEAERAQAAQAVLALLADPTFGPIFTTQSRAEVGVAGKLQIGGVERAVTGKVDRLAVTGDWVLIVDFKTNRPAPADLDEIAPAYVVQMALYRALIQPLYPARRIRAALLFTEGPALFELPPHMLDEALARLAGA